MGRLKGIRIVWASALALGLFQFGLLAIRMIGQNPTVWNVYFWPYLSMLLLAAPVVVVSLVSGVLIRPQRPERLAATVGAVAGFCVFGVRFILPLASLLPRLGEMISLLLAGLPVYGGRIGPPLIPPDLRKVVSIAFGVASFCGLPLAISCWLGANYWRSASWRQFWRGPGGAILRGGLVAGAVCVPLSIVAGWWHYERLEELGRHLPAASYHYAPWPGYPWGHLLVSSPSGITTGAVIVALLAQWRPHPALGAFAGSGILLGTGALFLALSLCTSPPHVPFGLRTALALQVPRLLVSVVLGAVAGSFAGRWEDVNATGDSEQRS